MIYDDGQPIAEKCPECGSRETVYEPTFGYWKCENCSLVWGHDKDDPDYDEPGLCPECNGAGTTDTDGYVECPICCGSGFIGD